ncbi:hypothetical protein [Halanaerobium hydrogeniformans]|uniref:Uncharacterized protein n=1 Tax=Halanaerobium hydrogeniformans TaxID=656519 RepID=E4RN95_HALHG|nr:hypothetical protein [Halanaerobium hydrogeniformans]ADQ13563.1 hypothetical protein Halsa_0067 [Halanaerobium hydrogeniformans]
MLNEKAKSIFIETMEAIKTQEFILNNKDGDFFGKVCCGQEKVVSRDKKTGKERFICEEELLIDPIKNTYQCNKCGSKGTIIEWYSKAHGCNFSESIQYINDYYNLNLLKDIDESNMNRIMKLVENYNDLYIKSLEIDSLLIIIDDLVNIFSF